MASQEASCRTGGGRGRAGGLPDPAEDGRWRWAGAHRHWRHEPRGREIPLAGASSSDARTFLRCLFRNAPAPKPVGAYFDRPHRGRRPRHCATLGPRASEKSTYACFYSTYLPNYKKSRPTEPDERPGTGNNYTGWIVKTRRPIRPGFHNPHCIFYRSDAQLAPARLLYALLQRRVGTCMQSMFQNFIVELS